MYTDLIYIKERVYHHCGFKYFLTNIESESTEYSACSFEVNNLKIIFRTAKSTPKKIGQFVTLWKRAKNSPIQPYDSSDEIDFFVISTKNNNNFGQFVFPKPVLLEKNILSSNEIGGKLGFRVYSPWDTPINKQAKAAQAWQLKYFLENPKDKPIDCIRANMLYSKNNKNF